jgi:hypothetical protein
MTSNKSETGSNIVVLFSAHSEYRGIYVNVARKLKKNGARIIWYVTDQQKHDYYQTRFRDSFDKIVLVKTLYDKAVQPVEDPEPVIQRAREIESTYGVTINTVAMTDRHLGRGFALGGHRHPKSRMSERSSYHSILNAYSELYAFWEGQIDEYKPDLIIGGGKIPSLLARCYDIPFRSLAESKYLNYYYWGVDEFYQNPNFEKNFTAGTVANAQLELTRPYASYQQMSTSTKSELMFWGMVKRFSLTAARYAYWTVRGYQKARGYFASEQLKYIWRQYVEHKSLAQYTRPLSSLEGVDFVFFPLHTEPETAVQLLSPECISQLSCIATLARDLPAGTVLAVKETLAGIGRRPRDFYSQIADFKNVVFLDSSELGLDVIFKASVVATITGTAGFEAAVLGKPVISFGQHTMYKFLDHVKVATDHLDLSQDLQFFLSPEFDKKKAREDGQRFVQAVVASSMDLGKFDVTDPEKVGGDVSDGATQRLLDDISDRSPALLRADPKRLAQAQ